MLLKRSLLVCAALFFAVGCETRIGDFTAISSKNIVAKGVDVTKLPKTEGVEGQKTWFLGIGQNIKDPMDIALEKAHGNLMVDAALYYENYILFGGFKVRGTVVNVPYSGPAAAAAASTADGK